MQPENTQPERTREPYAENLLRLGRDLAIALGASSSLSSSLDEVLATACSVAGIDCGGVYLVEPSGDLQLVASRGLSSRFVEHASRFSRESPQVRLVSSVEPIYREYSEMSDIADAYRRAEGLVSVAILPVRHEGQLVAVLNLASRTCKEILPSTRDALETISVTIAGILARLRAEEAVEEGHRNTELLFDTMDDLLLVLDFDRRILRCNAAAPKLLGYTAEELKGRDVLELYPQERRQEAGEIISDMISGRVSVCTMPLAQKNGLHLPVEMRVKRGSWGGRNALIGLARDTSESTRAVLELEKYRTHLEELVEARTEEFEVANRRLKSEVEERRQAEERLRHRLHVQRVISELSSRFAGKYRIDEAIDASLRDMALLSGAARSYVFLLRDDSSFMDNTHEWCAPGVTPQLANLQNMPVSSYPWVMPKLQQGETVAVPDVQALPAEAANERRILELQDIKSVLLVPIFVGDRVDGFVGFDNTTTPSAWGDDDADLLRVGSEIIGSALTRKRFEDELRALILRDPLTELYNRRGFLLAAEQNIRYANRKGTPASLVYVDVDFLKEINDTHGHDAGDQALREAAQILRSCFRQCDVLGRIGGDEFAVLVLENIQSQSEMISTRLQEGLRVLNSSSGRHHMLSLSWGIVSCSRADSTDIRDLMRRADARMYKAKGNKRNGCRLGATGNQ